MSTTKRRLDILERRARPAPPGGYLLVGLAGHPDPTPAEIAEAERRGQPIIRVIYDEVRHEEH